MPVSTQSGDAVLDAAPDLAPDEEAGDNEAGAGEMEETLEGVPVNQEDLVAYESEEIDDLGHNLANGDQSVALPFEIFPDGQDNGAQDEQPAAADAMTVPADEPADDAEDSAVPRAAMVLKTTPAKQDRLSEPFEEQGHVRRRKEDHSPQSKALFHPDEQGYRCPSPQQNFEETVTKLKLTQTSLGSNKSRLKELSEVET